METAFLAAADIRLVVVRAFAMARRAARRLRGSASSGKVRSIAMISARSCFNTASAPCRANSRRRSGLRLIVSRATHPPLIKLTEANTYRIPAALNWYFRAGHRLTGYSRFSCFGAFVARPSWSRVQVYTGRYETPADDRGRSACAHTERSRRGRVDRGR